MTQVGDIKELGNGLIQKTFSYEPLSALVDIVFSGAMGNAWFLSDESDIRDIGYLLRGRTGLHLIASRIMASI